MSEYKDKIKVYHNGEKYKTKVRKFGIFWGWIKKWESSWGEAYRRIIYFDSYHEAYEAGVKYYEDEKKVKKENIWKMVEGKTVSTEEL